LKKTATIKDIARNLSISPSTVSRALKDNPEISAETKKKVWKVAKELDYEPNLLALNLRQQRTHTIGVVLPEIVHYFFSTGISGIEEIANKKGFNVIISQSNESEEREISAVRALFNHRVDGILACLSKETANFDHFLAIQDKGKPIVFFDRTPLTMDASKVSIDDEDGGHQATMHLLNSGKTKLIHLAGPEKLSISQERLKGFIRAHQEKGMIVDDDQIIPCGSGTEAEAHAIIRSLLGEGRNFDGVFAVNDMAAVGAMNAIKEANLNIPEDVSVVGFSNWQVSSFVSPPLTTINQPGFLIGQKATELLIKEIEMKENEFIEPTTLTLPVELVKRSSA
jgi:LacI family transcriptional regulator